MECSRASKPPLPQGLKPFSLYLGPLRINGNWKPCPLTRKRVYQLELLVLLGAAGCGDGTDGFVFRLQDDAIKWSRAHEASANHADPAQRESAVRTALPGTSTVAAFEDHAARVAGGQQALVRWNRS